MNKLNITYNKKHINNIILTYFPNIQAIYLFGSYGTEDEWSNSDIDIALLLPHEEAKQIPSLYLHPLHSNLTNYFKKPVDLINLRQVNVVLRKEIIMAERLIYCADKYIVDEFEMLTISFYLKLNEERKAILEDFFHTKRAYNL
jgi:predicted nucleotidyltransferase